MNNTTTTRWFFLMEILFFFQAVLCGIGTWFFQAELQVLEEKLRNTEECRVRELRNFENQVWWRGSEFIARFFCAKCGKIHHDVRRWDDMIGMIWSVIIRVCHTHNLSFREWKVPRSWVFAWLLTASDTRHPSRVNGKKRDVNCRRRFAICSYLKPGYGYYGVVGYVFVGSNCFRVCSHTTSKTFKNPINSIYLSSFSCITEGVSPEVFMTAFLFTKGHFFFKFSTIPMVFCVAWDSAGWSPSYRIGSRAQTSTTLPGGEKSVNFQISRVFLGFFWWVLNGRVSCKYDASMMGFDSCFRSDISNM